MPSGVQVGHRTLDFASGAYEFDKLEGLSGGLQIGPAELGETREVGAQVFDKELRASANGYHRVELRGRYYHLSDKEFGQLVRPLPSRWPHSFAWATGDTFSFGAWVEEDRRARVLRGKPGADGELKLGSPGTAQQEIESVWSRYKARRPGDIPTDPGACTPHGFLVDPRGQPERQFSAHLPYRSEAQPALVYTVSMVPALPDATHKRLEDQPQPWRETREEAKLRRQEGNVKDEWISVGPGSIVEKYLEPQYLTVAGQRARLSGVKFRPAMDQYDYEVQIETLGDPTDPLKPRIVLMAQGLKAGYYAGLKGQPPAPPLEQVLPALKLMAQSVRVRGSAGTKP